MLSREWRRIGISLVWRVKYVSNGVVLFSFVWWIGWMENGWMDGVWVVVVFVDGWLYGMMSCRLGD